MPILSKSQDANSSSELGSVMSINGVADRANLKIFESVFKEEDINYLMPRKTKILFTPLAETFDFIHYKKNEPIASTAQSKLYVMETNSK